MTRRTPEEAARHIGDQGEEIHRVARAHGYDGDTLAESLVELAQNPAAHDPMHLARHVTRADEQNPQVQALAAWITKIVQ